RRTTDRAWSEVWSRPGICTVFQMRMRGLFASSAAMSSIPRGAVRPGNAPATPEWPGELDQSFYVRLVCTAAVAGESPKTFLADAALTCCGRYPADRNARCRPREHVRTGA